MTEKEIRYHRLYMDISARLAEMSFCKRKKVGALAVRDGRIISMGWNGQPSGYDNCCEDSTNTTLPTVIHAEENLIKKLKRDGESAEGSTVYITMAPCRNCSELLVDAGVKEVFYLDVYRSTDGIEYLSNRNIAVTKLEINT